MFFPVSVASATQKIREKLGASAASDPASPESDRMMLFMSMFTLTLSSPGARIISRAPLEPKFTCFFGTGRDEGESFTLAACHTTRDHHTFSSVTCMITQYVTTKTLRTFADTNTIMLKLGTPPTYIDSTLNSIYRSFALGIKQLLDSRGKIVAVHSSCYWQ